MTFSKENFLVVFSHSREALKTLASLLLLLAPISIAVPSPGVAQKRLRKDCRIKPSPLPPPSLQKLARRKWVNVGLAPHP